MIGSVETLPVARADAAESGLGVASIEAWPAVGGGLLVGLAEPEFAGAAAVRRSVKTVFIRIGIDGAPMLLLPYVSLEPETRRCIRLLVALELSLPEACLTIGSLEHDRHRIVDLGPQAEISLQACAAVVRALLLGAAAEDWAVPVHCTRVAAGTVIGPERGQIVPFGAVAADAALASVPETVQLLSGRSLSLRAPEPRRALPASSHALHMQRIQP